jgi:hypothetical protein
MFHWGSFMQLTLNFRKAAKLLPQHYVPVCLYRLCSIALARISFLRPAAEGEQ